MRTWLLALMTVLVAFSGCFGGDDGGDDTTTTPTATSTETETETPEPNKPPTASISASIEQGEIPFNVTFDLDASDADGDALSWTLDADGDEAPDAEGTELPANHTFTYEAEGLYNVTFTVSDGTDQDVQTLVINATAAAGGTGPVQEATGSWEAGSPTLCAGSEPNPYHPANSGADGVTLLIIDLEEGTHGKPFTATFGPKGAGEQSAHVWFSSEDEIAIESFDSSDDPAVITGKVPAGSGKVSFGTCGPSGNSVTIVIG